MPKIQAETANGLVETEAPAGKKLVLALEDAGIDILHRCGGNARCTTCRVEVLEGDPGEMGELPYELLASVVHGMSLAGQNYLDGPVAAQQQALEPFGIRVVMKVGKT